jgi:hypothetical protein
MNWYHCAVELRDGRTPSVSIKAVDAASAELRIHALRSPEIVNLVITDKGPVKC